MTKAPSHVKCIDITWEGHADCQLCAIRKSDIMADVDVTRFERLLRRITQFKYAKKTMLFVEGSPADSLYVVRKGTVKLEESLPDGSPRIVRVVKKAGVVGLEAFLNNHQRYDQTAIALQDAEVCRIPNEVIKNLLDEDPEFYKSVMKEWHDQMEASNEVIVEYSTGALKKRLVAVLLMLIEEAKRNAQIEIEMLHIDDMAALTGVTRESVSRIISEFKRDKLLEKSSPGKMKFDEAGFRKVAESFAD